MPEWDAIHKYLILFVFLCSWVGTGLANAADPAPGECPQRRNTAKAPADYLSRTNPLPASPEVLAAAERSYPGKSKSVPCLFCHGAKGDGKGYLASQYVPRPRNFTCKEIMSDLPDGQLFWIIQNGSPDTAMPPQTGSSMPAYRNLTDEEIWQLVRYIRNFAR
jgi:cytochrome c553